MPADDADLDALIVETLQEGGVLEFHFVVMAALSSGRPVEARHLRKGVMRLQPADRSGRCRLGRVNTNAKLPR